MYKKAHLSLEALLLQSLIHHSEILHSMFSSTIALYVSPHKLEPLLSVQSLTYLVITYHTNTKQCDSDCSHVPLHKKAQPCFLLS